MSFWDEIGNFFIGKNPADAANKYYEQIPGAVNPYYQPYINSGQNALGKVTGQYDTLMNDPNAMYNKFSEGYKESPGYQTRLTEALRGITNAEAAGGMAGSQEHQSLSAQKALDLHGQDFENYLNHVLGLYGTGLQGTQGLETQGFGASTGYGDILGSNLAQQGGAAYNGQAGQNAARSQMFKNFVNMAAMAMGGPAGAAAGALAGPMSGSSVAPWSNPG